MGYPKIAGYLPLFVKRSQPGKGQIARWYKFSSRSFPAFARFLVYGNATGQPDQTTFREMLAGKKG